VQQTGGSPLPESVQKDFEERLGQDFSQVRIHTGSRPATTARQLKAKAFTVGNDVVFGQGQFAPNTTAGKRLIAHELTHVGQRRAASPVIQRQEAATDEASDEASPEEGKDVWAGTAVNEVVLSGSSRVTFQTAKGPIHGTVEKLDLAPGSYTLTPNLRFHTWTISGAGVTPGLRFYVNLEGALPWTLSYPNHLPLRVGTDNDADSEQTPITAEAPKAIDVSENSAKIAKILRDDWFPRSGLMEVFESCASEAEFLALVKQIPLGTVLDKLTEWDVVRLATFGPLPQEYAERLTRTRANYINHIVRERGAVRSEVFTLFLIDNAANDELESVLRALASDQELYLTIARMPTVKARLESRGIALSQFHDRGWQASDILTGLGHGLQNLAGQIPLEADAREMQASGERQQLPKAYREASFAQDMNLFLESLTPGRVVFGTIDYVAFGLPSAVKGVVYDLPASVIGGVDQIAQGHVAGGVEVLTGSAVAIVALALGVRAFRKARIDGLLELTAEGKTLYNALKVKIGNSGLQRVAGYVQRNAAARMLVVEEGQAGIEALHATKGDVAAARTLIERARIIPHTGNPSGVTTGMPNTFYARPNEYPYTPPPDMKVVRPGSPLRIETLDPSKRYLWVIDEAGNFRIAAEGQTSLFPRRGRLRPPHPQAGETPIKHGDLVPGPGGGSRGVARAGGELHPEMDASGRHTGRWMMDNNSSYTFARLDGTELTRSELEAALRLLGTTGTDISKLILRTYKEGP
jgi:hypothetical protein